MNEKSELSLNIIMVISLLIISFLPVSSARAEKEIKESHTNSSLKTHTDENPPVRIIKPQFSEGFSHLPIERDVSDNESVYGPHRNDPNAGIREHTYSPFENNSKSQTNCPSGGCDFVAGQLVIKLKDIPTRLDLATKKGPFEDNAITTKLYESGILELNPVFPSAKKPFSKEIIETPEGTKVPKPDLTQWYLAKISEDEDLFTVIESLKNLEGVVWAEPDYIRKPADDFSKSSFLLLASVEENKLGVPDSSSDPLFAQQYHLGATQVPEAWGYLESLGLTPGGSRDVIVAVIDSGVNYTHPDLAANIWTNQAEFNGIPNVDDDGNGYVDDIHGVDIVTHTGDPQDDHGHGTHVAGIIAAQAENGIGGVGIAYNVQIMPIKAAQYSGALSTTDIAQGIYYAIANGADVINMSFGGYSRSTIEEDALTVAFGNAVLVAAAGNDGIPNEFCNKIDGSPFYPAAYNWVLGVMVEAEFSNYDCIAKNLFEYEVVAPGLDIWSTLPPNQYAAWDGTSMAAPIVSGIAALARSAWHQEDGYSSRFIMGQIVSNAAPQVNAYATLTKAPRPDLNYLEHWLFDTSSQSSINDNDGIVDSGETIDLAVVIRNQWGKADPVSVKLEPWAQGAFQPDPYITMLADTVDYGAIGAFSWDDNGLIYDTNGVITGVESPFKFVVDPSTPNNHLIPFRLTISAGNYYDATDPDSPYTYISYFYLIVQKGVVLPSIIATDMNLDKDHYWIIDKPVLIPAGVTVTVTPGTQIQFWSSEPHYPYGEMLTPYLQVEGELLVLGSLEEPVEIFPSMYFLDQQTVIKKETYEAYVNISYAKILNPALVPGYSSSNWINIIDHSYFDKNELAGWMAVEAFEIKNTKFDMKIKPGIPSSYKPNNCDTCLYNNIPVFFEHGLRIRNSVFLVNYDDFWMNTTTRGINIGLSIYEPDYNLSLCPVEYEGHTYLVSSTFGTSGTFDYLHTEEWAQYLGGHIVTINDQSENQFVSNYFLDNFYYWDQLGHTPCSGCPSDTQCSGINRSHFYYGSPNIGLYRNDSGVYNWTSGETVDFTNWGTGEPLENYSILNPHPINGEWSTWSLAENRLPIEVFVIETNETLTQSEINTKRNWFINNNLPNVPDYSFGYNAILNRWWDPNPNHWFRFIYNRDFPSDNLKRRNTIFNISHNYWGGAANGLIDAAIYDANEDFNLAKAIYKPVLTDPPESAYPFVADVILSTDLLADTYVAGLGELNFTVSFNRDMDTSLQPMVSFGPAQPFTDFRVQPVGEGWENPRIWKGSINITPNTGDGYQLIRISNAHAADDHWLEIGIDAGRFRFEIITSSTQSMNLQATGGEGYVDLSWTQDDYDLLSGFALYRSTSIDGPYIRINQTIVPPDVRIFHDMAVQPGQPYYYKFAVIKSDMTESKYSNIAQATPLDTIPPILIHSPITTADPGMPLTISAEATDNVGVIGLSLFYRHQGDTNYLMKIMVKTTGNNYFATIDGSLLTSPGIEYYLEVTDGISVTRSGRAENPNLISVDDSPVITIVTPNRGPSTGETSITISGSNFKSGASVSLGGSLASDVVVVSSNQITCKTPDHFPSLVDVHVINPDTQSTVLLNGFTFESASATISLPETGGRNDDIIAVPIIVSNVHGLITAALTVTYNPDVIHAINVSTGNVTPGWTIAANLSNPGQVRLSMISPGGGVEGSGVLANIEFEVKGSPGSISPLSISSILLNDGAIPTETFNGIFHVDDVYNVSGSVRFWNGAEGVPDCLLTLDGNRIYSSVSNTDGSYSINGVEMNSYSLTASKLNAENGIGAYDASLALQHDVGLINLAGYAAIAADVNKSSTISAMDAYYILQKSVHLIDLPFPGSGKAWDFDPVQRTISNLDSDRTNQNFIGILLGDISGNWTQLEGIPDPHQNNSSKNPSAELTIQSYSIYEGKIIEIPINLNINEANLYGAEITIDYDSRNIAIPTVNLSYLASSWTLASNLSNPGKIQIALAGAVPINSNGELLRLTIEAIGRPGTETELLISHSELNEGAISFILNSGYIRIISNSERKVFLPAVIR